MWIIAPLSCGLIFGAGLLISGMVQPAKVLGFLDIFGAWDPSLAVVMAAALAVAVPGFRLAGRQTQPLFAGHYFRPTKAGIDAPLVVGAALFGIGWGLVGLCPGPALESLATLSPGHHRFRRCDGRRHDSSRILAEIATDGAARSRPFARQPTAERPYRVTRGPESVRRSSHCSDAILTRVLRLRAPV